MPPRKKNNDDPDKIVKVVCVGRGDTNEEDLIDDVVIADEDLEPNATKLIQDRLNECCVRLNQDEACLMNVKQSLEERMRLLEEAVEDARLRRIQAVRDVTISLKRIFDHLQIPCENMAALFESVETVEENEDPEVVEVGSLSNST